ncbi:hypothetical protein V5799_021806 [Amblyomma americanum]|uniref:Tyrosine-protein phosphatase domain-containing protein n=1 Tax=Amblyomma americanum TaxID=6943 RepID=A0AAQ4FP97_AMBAM
MPHLCSLQPTHGYFTALRATTNVLSAKTELYVTTSLAIVSVRQDSRERFATHTRVVPPLSTILDNDVIIGTRHVVVSTMLFCKGWRPSLRGADWAGAFPFSTSSKTSNPVTIKQLGDCITEALAEALCLKKSTRCPLKGGSDIRRQMPGRTLHQRKLRPSPTPSTTSYFWWMVWQEHASMVVMIYGVNEPDVVSAFKFLFFF